MHSLLEIYRKRVGITRLALDIAARRLEALGDTESDAYKIARETLDTSSVEDIFIAKEVSNEARS